MKKMTEDRINRIDRILKAAAVAGLAAAMMLCAGCSLLGKNAKPATAFEKKFFTVETNIVELVKPITNIVTIVQTNVEVKVVTVTQTNQIGVPVPVPVQITNYNTVTSYQTNTGYSTNYAAVEHLSPGTGSNATVAAVGAGAGLFGYGGLATTLLGGLLAGYLKLRNNALAGQADTMTQVSGALTQNIETLLNVLQSTPQGAAAMPAIKAYLTAHQADANVFQEVATIIENFVDEPAAKQSADEIIKALGTLSAPGVAATTVKV